MSFKELWETPAESINGCSEIVFNYSQDVVKIMIEYKKNGENARCILTFNGVIYFRRIGGYFVTASELVAYEKLIEFEKSDLLKELKKRDPKEFELWKCRHFSIYTADDRLFDIVAKDYEITYE